MSSAQPPVSSSLEQELERLRHENASLKAQLEASARATRGGPPLEPGVTTPLPSSSSPSPPPLWFSSAHSLSSHQVERCSRQMLLRSFGAEAQSKLCAGSALVVGAGGLGSPCLLYLAAAGVGRLGIVDKDTVDLSNLHRQTIHREATVGLHKAESARRAIAEINSTVQVDLHLDGLTPSNAVQLVERYDVVIDCSDNAPTRYLLSDACAAVRRPLVSGAAIGTDGQLTIYCAGHSCPCYRCLYPEAPVPENCQRCNEAGVLGVVPGVIGTLQALEAIKLLSGKGDPLRQKLLIFDALAMRFAVMKLRPANPECPACGANASINRETIATFDYRSFTGQDFLEDRVDNLHVLPPQQRIDSSELSQLLNRTAHGDNPILDVRPLSQFQLAQLPGSLNLPFPDAFNAEFAGDDQGTEGGPRAQLDKAKPLAVVCRRGNDSQLAVQRLRELGFQGAVDLAGGLEAWRREGDGSFPKY